MTDFLTELKERHVFRVAIGYAAVAWVVAQIAEFALDTFEAPGWILQYLVIALLLGLPIAIVLAWVYEITPDGVKRDKGANRDTAESVPAGRRKRGPVILAALVLVSGLSTYTIYQQRQSGVAQAAAMDKLDVAAELTAEDRFGEAYAVVQRVISVLGNAPEVRRLMSEIAVAIDPRIADDNMVVSFRPYGIADASWVEISGEQDKSVLAPKGGLLLKVEKPGYGTREFAVANPGPMLQNIDPVLMAAVVDYPIPELEAYEAGEVADGMVRVPATDIPIFMSGFAVSTLGDQRYSIPAFDISRSEVSNREFKAFVDDRGYGNPAFWSGLQLVGGGAIDEETIATFLDTTGRPGPANWELGNYPTGAAEMPVGGISLYEAKAYARYRGMVLPTIHHWARAAFAPMEGMAQIAPFVARDSNFGNAPVAVDSERGIGPWGTRHMAGNAREWVWNTSGGYGLALGGAWNNYDDIYQQAYTIDPLDRAPQNGLRLMHTRGEPVDSQLLAAIDLNEEAMTARREPVSDEAFEALRFQFSHARRTPASISIVTVEENDSWHIEEITLQFAGDQEFTLFVVKPAMPADRLQPVIYMAHVGAVASVPNRELLEQMRFMDYVVRAGRAIVIPVFDGMAQRYREAPADEQAARNHYRRQTLARYEDIATTIDYLESRDDMVTESIGFLGFSYGAYQSATFLAIENRITALVLISGGAPYWEYADPISDPVNYYSRITTPALLINGRHDHLFTYDNSQLYMLELLGAPDEDKVHLVFEEGHFDFPRNTVAREVSGWLDKYLGLVR